MLEELQAQKKAQAMTEQSLYATRDQLLQANNAVIAAQAAALAARTVRERTTLDTSRLVNKPQAFSGEREAWEAWKFAYLSYIGTVHKRLPDLMEQAAKSQDSMSQEDYDESTTNMSIDLYALLVSLLTKGNGPGICRAVRNRDGFEVWRLMSAEFTTRGKSKTYEWL